LQDDSKKEKRQQILQLAADHGHVGASKQLELERYTVQGQNTKIVDGEQKATQPLPLQPSTPVVTSSSFFQTPLSTTTTPITSSSSVTPTPQPQQTSLTPSSSVVPPPLDDSSTSSTLGS